MESSWKFQVTWTFTCGFHPAHKQHEMTYLYFRWIMNKKEKIDEIFTLIINEFLYLSIIFYITYPEALILWQGKLPRSASTTR